MYLLTMYFIFLGMKSKILYNLNNDSFLQSIHTGDLISCFTSYSSIYVTNMILEIVISSGPNKTVFTVAILMMFIWKILELLICLNK